MSRLECILRASAAGIALVLVSACAAKVPPPEKTIADLYAPYVSQTADRADFPWEKAAVYSKSLKATIDRGIEYSLLLSQPVIDFNPLVAAQNASINNLIIEVDHPPVNGRAHVVARFENSNRQTTIGYDMVLEDGSWKVDAIRSGKVDFRKSIDDALKASGNPDEMKAPVKAIYTRYRESTRVEPLHNWAPLTNDLRDKLASAESKSVALGFDPVCGGRSGVPANVKLEAVGGVVIARFQVDGHERIAVFDVVENQGDWTIDDIHSPGKPAWDLVQKLAAAGIR